MATPISSTSHACASVWRPAAKQSAAIQASAFGHCSLEYMEYARVSMVG